MAASSLKSSSPALHAASGLWHAAAAALVLASWLLLTACGREVSEPRRAGRALPADSSGVGVTITVEGGGAWGGETERTF